MLIPSVADLSHIVAHTINTASLLPIGSFAFYIFDHQIHVTLLNPPQELVDELSDAELGIEDIDEPFVIEMVLYGDLKLSPELVQQVIQTLFDKADAALHAEFVTDFSLLVTMIQPPDEVKPRANHNIRFSLVHTS